MSGTIAPCAAAAIGFGGSNDVTHAANVCGLLAVISPAASAAPGGNAIAPCFGKRSNRTKASGMTAMATIANNIRNTSSVRPPTRPIARTSAAEAIPVMRSETTSGITVMRMALIHNAPIGAMASAARTSDALPDAAIAIPATIATARVIRTRVDSFIYIIKSPPLMSSDAPVMYPAASEAAKQIRSATSRAVPRRGTG